LDLLQTLPLLLLVDQVHYNHLSLVGACSHVLTPWTDIVRKAHFIGQIGAFGKNAQGEVGGQGAVPPFISWNIQCDLPSMMAVCAAGTVAINALEN
jgi:hypothetical protein